MSMPVEHESMIRLWKVWIRFLWNMEVCFDFGGGITNEAKFGFYKTDNPDLIAAPR